MAQLLERVNDLFAERDANQRDARRAAWECVRNCLYMNWASRNIADERFASFAQACELLGLASAELNRAATLIGEAGRIQAGAIADRKYASTGDGWVGADIKLDAIRRQYPPLFDGDSCATSITLDMRFFDELRERLNKAIESLPRQLEPEHCDDARSSLAGLAWQTCRGESLSDGDIATSARLLAATNFSDYEWNLSLVAFAHRLEEASSRDEFDCSNWHDGVRPSIASVRLEQLRRERPLLMSCDQLVLK